MHSDAADDIYPFRVSRAPALYVYMVYSQIVTSLVGGYRTALITHTMDWLLKLYKNNKNYFKNLAVSKEQTPCHHKTHSMNESCAGHSFHIRIVLHQREREQLL